MTNRRSWRLMPHLAGSLGQRLALLFVIALLPPTVISVYLAWDAFSGHTKQAKTQVRQLAVLAATFERKFFEDTRKALQRIAESDSVRQENWPRCEALLAENLEAATEYAGLAVYDMDGQLVCGTSLSRGNVARQPWFHDAIVFRGFTISDYVNVQDSPFPVIVASLGLFDEKGVFKGVVAAYIELYWLVRFLREAQLPSEGVFFLLDSKGDVLASPSSFVDNDNPALPKAAPNAGKSTPLQDVVREDLIAKVLSGQLVNFEAVGNDGVRRLYSSVALPHGNVTLLFGIPSAITVGPIEQDLITRLLGLAAIWIAGIGTVWLATRRLVTRWTTALRRVALSYARGDYSAHLETTHAPAELRDLGDTLLLMAGRIEAREADLHNSIAQKDVLIKEIHHRVKNNLQIVSSLLNLHGKSTSDPDERETLQEVKSRVRALAMVHRYLYEGEDVQLVDFRAFVTELCDTLLNTLSHATDRLSLSVEIPAMMILSTRAVPVALLVVETMTNSMKHAFPDGRAGEIWIRFEDSGDGRGTLTIADNGIGHSHSLARSGSLGFRLIKAFAQQIEGEVEILGDGGTTVRVHTKMAALTGRAGSVTPPPMEYAGPERGAA